MKIKLSIALFIILLVVGTITNTAFCQAKTSQKNTEEVKISIQEAHQQFAVELNNLVWDLLMKENRTLEESEKMVHAAHASHYHWGVIGLPENTARGYWLISHVYAVLDKGGLAVFYANRCWDITNKLDLKDFDLAYAYEAYARAYASNREAEKAQYYFQLAREAGERIARPEDRQLFFTDLNTEPWFGAKVTAAKETETGDKENMPQDMKK